MKSSLPLKSLELPTPKKRPKVKKYVNFDDDENEPSTTHGSTTVVLVIWTLFNKLNWQNIADMDEIDDWALSSRKKGYIFLHAGAMIFSVESYKSPNIVDYYLVFFRR